jgi:hypothetical protein
VQRLCGDTPHESSQKEKNMTNNQRFVLNENRDVIDKLNPAGNPVGYFYGDDTPKDEVRLRESVLLRRLGKLVDDLIINLQPEEEDHWGNKYKPFNSDSHAIWWAISVAIRASHLNTLNPAESIRNRFDGKLKRQKDCLQEFTSLSLFRDDVERLLRDLYGDIDSEALDQILRAVLGIVQEFTRYVRKTLWQEHEDAVAWDYIRGIGVLKGYGISSTEWRCGMIAISDLAARAREVLKNPSAFSEYTVEFAKYYEQNYIAGRS